jgi:hypothetical protein
LRTNSLYGLWSSSTRLLARAVLRRLAEDSK